MAEAKQIDCFFIEKRLDREYDDLFGNKLRDSIKGVKLENNKCILKCVENNYGDKECLERCDESHKKYFSNIEKAFKEKLSRFEGCKEKCFERKDFKKCQMECVESLNNIFSSESLYVDISRNLSKVSK